MITIEQIKTELREMIALGDAATAGPRTLGDENNQHAEICIGDAVASLDRQDRYGLHMVFSRREMLSNVHFTMRSRTMTPLACKGLLMAIEGLEDVPNDTADVIERRIIQLWEESK
jgi:hypothetical protein